ncbi:MAG: hypothetical protein AAGA55_00205 [Planctomycetota bacterium]
MPQSSSTRRSRVAVVAAPVLLIAGLWMGDAFASQPQASTINTASGPATPYPDGMRVDAASSWNERSRPMLEDQGGVLRLHSIVVDSGRVRITEAATGRSIGLFSGGDWSEEENRFTGSDQVLLGGLPVRGPIEVVALSGGSRSRTTVHVYFWNQPAAP